LVKAYKPKNKTVKKVEMSRLLVLMKRLWKSYVRQHLRMIILTGVLMVISSGATSVQPLLIQQAFDKVFKEKDTFYLMALPLAIIAVFTVQAVTIYYSNFFMGRITNSLVADMRKALFTHVIDNEIEFYSKNDSGSLLSRITGEILHIATAVTNFFNAWCRQLITTIGLFLVMLHQSVELTLVSMVAFVFAFIPLVRITTRLKKLTRQLHDKNGNLHSRLIESLTGVRTVKAFRKEEFEIEKISGYIDEIREASNRTNMISIITAPLMQIVGGVAVAFVIWFGGHQVIQGHMTEGNLVAFIAALMMFSRPVRSLTTTGNVMVKGYVAADRFFDILDSKPKYISREHGIKLAVKKAEIIFDHVSFKYPNGAVALDDVSFTAQAGKKTALVGHSGSGKSTIFSLIMKFYNPTSGHIRFDGQDFAEASINSVRENLALVSQDIFIFDETAMNNIGYGREGSTEEEIIAAAKAAHCHDFIMALPNGYKTKLGFAGESLSGGQKQRIAIARAFLRNAPILLLDEATSALDPRTEADIQAALDVLSKNRTTIIIAHRLSTVVNADHMVLMEAGHIAATGTHESLLRDSPLYRHHFGI
jgi:subfamily B ATP-binding cassette protein MsbA